MARITRKPAAEPVFAVALSSKQLLAVAHACRLKLRSGKAVPDHQAILARVADALEKAAARGDEYAKGSLLGWAAAASACLDYRPAREAGRIIATQVSTQQFRGRPYDADESV